jgi:CARDB
MRRALLTLVVFLAFPGAAQAASVRVTDCVPALDPEERTATFEARMRSVRDSERMQVRFALQAREDELHPWRRVVAEGFDTWLTSMPDVRRYSYAKTVVNLSAPAAYRTVVRFRWLDLDGAVVKSAREVSASCRQPDMRPNLVPRRVDVLPGPDADTRSYAVTVRNDGRSDADPFTATFQARDLGTLAVLGLAPGAQRVVTFVAPPCTAGAPLTVTLDPDEAVDERDEDDNVLIAPCPPP